jgi:cyclin H
MVEYIDSAQNNAWHFTSNEELMKCRAYTNYRARLFLYQYELQQQQQPQPQHQGSDDTTNSKIADEVVSTPISATSSIVNSSSEPTIAPDGISSGTHTNTVDVSLSYNEPISWSTYTTTMINSLPVSCYVCNMLERKAITKDPTVTSYEDMGPWYSPVHKKNKYISPQQELTLIHFYGSKISSMIGPNAEVKRLRRESKVVATAAILYRRFFLSNSVLLYDPKIIMIASTFLACKVEDVTADIRYIEQGTQLLNAPITIPEIVNGEIILLSGVHYDLLCFHSYKSTLAFTEDLRTFLKTSIGQQAFTIYNDTTTTSSRSNNMILSGQDLKPMYDTARTLLDLIIISDIPFMYSPGQIGIAALTVAHNEIVKQKNESLQQQQQQQQQQGQVISVDTDILCRVYIPSRFSNVDQNVVHMVPETIIHITDEIRILQEQHAYRTNNVEPYMADLKSIHKQLKKVRVWGNTTKEDGKSSNDKKKSKKRSASTSPNENISNDDAVVDQSSNKRIKTE